MWVMILLVSLILCSLSFSNAVYSPRHRESIPTDVCDVTTLAELVDLQTKVNYERIACEAKIDSWECSRYWMANNELIRRKLSYEQCSQQEREKFQTWAGTIKIDGEFQSDYYKTLNLIKSTNLTLYSMLLSGHDETKMLFLTETSVTRNQLYSSEDTTASNERSNVFVQEFNQRNLVSSTSEGQRAFIETSGNEERTLVTNQETQTRNFAGEDGSQSRQTTTSEHDVTRNLMTSQLLTTSSDDSKEEGETRDKSTSEENSNRDLVKATEENHRVRISQEADQTRNLEREEQQDIRNLTSTKENNNRAEDSAEENATREQTISQETETRSDNQNQEQTTKTLAHQEYQSIRGLTDVEENNNRVDYSQKESNTRSNDASEESNIRDLEQQQHDILKSEAKQSIQTSSTMTNPSIQQQSQNIKDTIGSTANDTQNIITNSSSDSRSTWNGAANAILANLFGFQGGVPVPLFDNIALHFNLVQTYKKSQPSVELYSKNENFVALRNLVNSTLAYNLEKYGRTSNSVTAASFWTAAESFRNGNSFRYAVQKYSAAYYWAIKP